MYIHYPSNWLTLGTDSSSSQSNVLMTHSCTHTHTHMHAQQPFTQEDLAGADSPLNFCGRLSELSAHPSSLATKANSASRSAGRATCAICTDTPAIILHVIVRQIGGQRQRRQGSVARDTEEMFNHRAAHSGGSPFSLSSLWFISLSVLSFSAHSCRASTGRKMYYGWVNLLINIQPLDPAFPRWPIKNYNWQRAKARQQVAVGPRAGGCDRRCGSWLGLNKSRGLSTQKDKSNP